MHLTHGKVVELEAELSDNARALVIEHDAQTRADTAKYNRCIVIGLTDSEDGLVLPECGNGQMCKQTLSGILPAVVSVRIGFQISTSLHRRPSAWPQTVYPSSVSSVCGAQFHQPFPSSALRPKAVNELVKALPSRTLFYNAMLRLAGRRVPGIASSPKAYARRQDRSEHSAIHIQ